MGRIGQGGTGVKKPSNLWRYVFFLFLFILIYQFHNSWDNDVSFDSTNKNIPEDSVAFLTIKEHNYGLNSRGFDSLMESLHTWEHNEKDKKVELKFEAYLPKQNSKVLFVYDKEFTTFEKYVDVVSVSTFPYNYRFRDKPLVEVHHVDENGNIYFLYKDKKIHLKPGQTYQSFGFSEFRFTRTVIENHGFYKKDDFSLFEEEKKAKKAK